MLHRILAQAPQWPATIDRSRWGDLLTRLALAVAVGVGSGTPTRDAAGADPGRAEPEAPPQDRVDFARDVQPLLARHCFACHGPDEVEAGLRLDRQEAALGDTDYGDPAIRPGRAADSRLVARIAGEEAGQRMPPDGDPLEEDQVELIRRWIDQGAEWSNHWAFEPMAEVVPPQLPESRWIEAAGGAADGDPPAGDRGLNPIDAFIFARLDAKGLRPSPPADRRTLLRRAFYDLTGLPPTAEQIESFVADPDPLAYEKWVDRLLDWPHYGERWGRHWLDLVRFAETNSFERDGAKPNAWKYRDYVIRSLNQGKPYSQFVREQLAGDELDNVTTETLTATGYYRLGIWDDEPADPLQARYDEWDDIISTTGQVMLGLTIDCARCHDHKIDPIPQTDYYRLLAFIADVTTYGTRGDQTSNNQIDVSPSALVERYQQNDRQRRHLERRMRQIEQSGIAQMSAADQRATEGPRGERQQVLDAKLKDHLDVDQWQQYRQLKAELAEVDETLKSLPPRSKVLGLAACDPDPEPTHVMFRGNPHSPSEPVQPGFPELFGQPPPEIPEPGPDATSAGRRRLLADWIVSPENRLTWRVIANRIWQFHFGRGIVRSSNNFGQLGTPPTHPELLDYLARRMSADGGRLKPIHRLIMTSRTYRMSSASDPQAAERDPANDLFWRFDPRRLSAEEVRDSILAVSGRLDRRLHGPSVYPRLSAEVLAGQSRPGSGWGESSQADESRRSVYIHVKRSLLVPLLSAFDLPEPDRSCEARFMTLQPGQALALLNGNFVHEQAEAFAKRIGGDRLDDASLAQAAVRTALGRAANDREIEQAGQLMADLQSDHGLSRAAAAELYCLTLFNWNEFLFLD